MTTRTFSASVRGLHFLFRRDAYGAIPHVVTKTPNAVNAAAIENNTAKLTLTLIHGYAPVSYGLRWLGVGVSLALAWLESARAKPEASARRRVSPWDQGKS
jgi:hypothetical protein